MRTLGLDPMNGIEDTFFYLIFLATVFAHGRYRKQHLCGMFIFQLLKLIAQLLIVLSKLFLNKPPFYGSANIFETQVAMEWPT
jgi:hypothetical protein